MKTTALTYFCVLILSSTYSLAYADFLCSSEISYKWKRGKEKESEERSIVLGLSRVVGPDEAAAKDKLTQMIMHERSKAEAKCKADHESLSHCISGKYAAEAQTLNSISFTARKGLEDAIQEDCKQAQGSCLGTANSDIACAEKVDANPATESNNKKDEPKKEEKGKKK